MAVAPLEASAGDQMFVVNVAGSARIMLDVIAAVSGISDRFAAVSRRAEVAIGIKKPRTLRAMRTIDDS